MNRNLGAQFDRLKQRAADKAVDYISRKMEPIHRAIVEQGERNQPEMDLALANLDRSLGRG